MARSYLTPMALPAVPASALHLASKSYADALYPEALVGADQAYVKYETGSAQTIGNGVGVVVSHGTAVQTHSIITQSTQGAGHKYTFNTTGIYAVTAQARFQSGGGVGERYHQLTSDMTNSGEWALCSWSTYSNGGKITMPLHYVGKFTAGSYVWSEVVQASGGNLDLEGSTVWKNIVIVLIRKYT